MVAVMLTGLEHGAKLVTLPRFESESYLNCVYQQHVSCLVYDLNYSIDLFHALLSCIFLI